jgi:hypothetical protein
MLDQLQNQAIGLCDTGGSYIGIEDGAFVAELEEMLADLYEFYKEEQETKSPAIPT